VIITTPGLLRQEGRRMQGIESDLARGKIREPFSLHFSFCHIVVVVVVVAVAALNPTPSRAVSRDSAVHILEFRE